MKPQCCAKGQKHQPALQPPQYSLPEIGTCIMTCVMIHDLCHGEQVDQRKKVGYKSSTAHF